MGNELFSTQDMLYLVNKYKSALELGCGAGNMISTLRAHNGTIKLVGLDAWPKAIEEAKKRVKKADLRVFDIRKLGQEYEADAFECIFGMDIIEHLTLDDAYSVLDDCDKIASKCQAFFIPVGVHRQTRDTKGLGGNHHWDTHRSTWYPDMMVKRGFEVWHFADWFKWPKGVPKDPRAMWCLKDEQSKAQIHECLRGE